jgi:hypothetical protein
LERRDFLALCAAPAVGGSATAFGAPSFPLPPPPDMEAYLARLDAGLDRIGRWTPAMGAQDDLARHSLQAMFVTGMLGDLPVEKQLDRGMQDRLFRSLPLFDDAVDGMTRFLASRTPQDFAAAQTALRSPGVRENLIARLDAEAEQTGVSAARRAQTRGMLRQVTWQLANQPPSLIVGEYLHKVEKVAATDVRTEARQGRLAARVGEKAFWTLQERAAQTTGGTATVQTRKKRGRGAKVLGIGFLVFAGGLGLAAASSDNDLAIGAGAVAATVGVVMILVGLVMLIVDATSKPQTENKPQTEKPKEPGRPATAPKP